MINLKLKFRKNFAKMRNNMNVHRLSKQKSMFVNAEMSGF